MAKVDMKKKYAGKEFTPLLGRGTAEQRKNTREFAKDLAANRKDKNERILAEMKKLLAGTIGAKAATKKKGKKVKYNRK